LVIKSSSSYKYRVILLTYTEINKHSPAKSKKNVKTRLNDLPLSKYYVIETVTLVTEITNSDLLFSVL